MSNVAFLNTLYIPTPEERKKFYLLQTMTNNFKHDVYLEDGETEWAKYRISLMVQARRAKMKLVKDGNEEF